jgi:hypothetical protein
MGVTTAALETGATTAQEKQSVDPLAAKVLPSPDKPSQTESSWHLVQQS